MLPNAALTSRPPLSRVRRRSSSFSESCSFDDGHNKELHRNGEGPPGRDDDGFCSDTFSTRERRMRKRIRKDPRTLPSAARAPVTSTSTYRLPSAFPAASCSGSSGRTRSPLRVAASDRSSFNPPSPVRARASLDSQMSAYSSPAASIFAQSTSPAASAYSDESLSDESSSAPPTPPPVFHLPIRAPGFALSLACTPASSHLDLDLPPRKHDRADEDDDAEISRLHHLAFEQLRRETDRDGEGFVERLRRWEDSRRRATFDRIGPGLGIVVDQDHGSGSGSAGRPSSPVSSHGDDLGDDEDDDELEVTLSQPPERASASRPTRPPPEFELADLVTRLSAEGLDDFSAVREYQSRCS